MPLSIPSRKSVVDSGRAYFQTNVPEWDTSTSRRSFAGGIVKSTMSALHDWYVALRQASLMFFPQTATGDFLTLGWWRDLTKLSPNPAAPAAGIVAVTGTPGVIVPAATGFTANGLNYSVDHDVSIITQALILTALTSSGGIAVAQTTNPHFFATGLPVTISGASQSQYNVAAVPILVIDDTTFSYPISGTPASPATGSPIVTATMAAVAITCTTKGQATNVDGGSTLNIAANIAGVDTTAIVTFGGIAGGTDVELPEAYRARVLQALGTDFGMFSAAELEIVAQKVPGVTRVFVRTASISPPPGWPQEGQVKIAFLRDNDANPLPTSQEVNDVKNELLALELPAHTAPEDLIVMSPPPFPIAIALSITPDLASMRLAVIASLNQFFLEQAMWGGTVALLDIECAIKATYDPDSRQALKSFTLSAPTGDIIAGTTAGYDVDDFPILNSVTFS